MEKKSDCLICQIDGVESHSHTPFYEITPPLKDAVADAGGEIKRFKRRIK